MKMKSQLLIMILMLSVNLRMSGQTDHPGNSNGILPNVIPGSTEAASLGKFGEWPVSKYTGVPDITIPLYSIKVDNFELPIQLSYHAGGIKVDDMSSWVGAGWTLNAGGAISRTIVGLADDWPGGLSVENSQAGGKFLKAGYNLSDTNDYIFFRNVASQQADAEPDIYYLNIGGLSAKFCIDSMGRFHSIPASNIQIISSPFTQTPGNPGSQTQWIIADGKGNTYYFGSNTPDPTGVSTMGVETSTSGISPVIAEVDRPTSWYITQIVTANQADTIYFDYTLKSEQYLLPPVISYKALINGSALPGSLLANIQYLNANQTLFNGNPQSGVKTSISKSYGYSTLARVRWRGGIISFVSNTRRQDMMVFSGGAIGGTMLDSINESTAGGTAIRAFALKYAYINQRYFLDSLSATGQPGSPGLVHTFGYISPSGLPSRGKYNQDHWGFCNGSSNTTLLPPSTQMPLISSGDLTANREPDPNGLYMQYGTLDTIRYPTGGYTVFTYEPNRYDPGSVRGTNPPPTPIVPASQFIQCDTLSPYARSVSFTIPFAQNNVSLQINFVNYSRSSGANVTPLPYVAIFPAGGSVAGAKTNGMYWNGYDNFPTTSPTRNADGTYNYSIKLNTLSLSAGNYVLVVSDSCGKFGGVCPLPGDPTSVPMTYVNAQIGYSVYQAAPPGGGPAPLPIAGGLRIRKMINYNTDGRFISARQYNYSPGNLLMYPQYVLHRQQDVTSVANSQSGLGDFSYCGPIEADIMEETSTSQTVLGLTQGATVGYAQVSELDVDSAGNDKGYINYSFSFYPDSMNVFNFDLSYTDWNNTQIMNPSNPVNSFEYKRGLLLHKDTYKKNANNTYTEIHSLTNDYNFNDYNATRQFTQIRGLRLQQLRYTPGYTCGTSYGGYILPANTLFSPDFGYSFYTITSSWVQHVTATEATFDQNGQNPVVAVTHYDYDNPLHMNPTRTTTNRSHGEHIISLVSYPQDYATGSTPFIDSLVSHHLISLPIETVKYQQDASGNITILGGQIATYQRDGKGLTDTIRVIASAAPVALSSFKWSNMPNAGLLPFNVVSRSPYFPDQTYIKRICFNYDQFGNILQDQKISDMGHSYLWDYTRVYPIAEVINAAQSDIAYTSFEADGTGNWNLSDTTRNRTSCITGNNSYNLKSSNTITRAGLKSGTPYIVSYWSSGGALNVNGTSATAKTSVGSWTYYEHLVTGATTVSVSGTATIDELRLFPKGALMTTYTYSPLIGKTSQCSPANYITYYTYDGLGRLATEKDMRNNILKTYQYNYFK